MYLPTHFWGGHVTGNQHIIYFGLILQIWLVLNNACGWTSVWGGGGAKGKIISGLHTCTSHAMFDETSLNTHNLNYFACI